MQIMYAHDKFFVRRSASFNVIPRSHNKKPTFAKIILATRETRRISFKERHEEDTKRDWKDIFVDEETKTRFVNCLYSFTIPSPFLPFLVRKAVQRAFSRERVLSFNFEEEAYERPGENLARFCQAFAKFVTFYERQSKDCRGPPDILPLINLRNQVTRQLRHLRGYVPWAFSMPR